MERRQGPDLSGPSTATKITKEGRIAMRPY